MNTKQLVILWYAGMLLTALLLLRALTNIPNALWPLMAAIVLMSAILIYTLRPHPQAKKSRLALWVLAPILLLATIGAGYKVYQANRAKIARILANAKLLTSDQYEFIDLTLEEPRAESRYWLDPSKFDIRWDIKVRLKNKSNFTIMQAKLQIVFSDNTGILDTRDVEFTDLAIPPGHVGRLDGYLVGGTSTIAKGKWTYRNAIVWGRP